MTKKTLKGSLISSLLVLALCFTALVGTTFAWFTDSAASNGNIIKTGSLDVEMSWAEGTADPATATYADASTGAIFNYDLWEPGYAVARHIKIENAGTLALKYKVQIIANGEVSKLADVIDVYYADPAVKVESRDALTDSMKIGTLTDVLAGMETTAAGNLLAGASHNITLVLKMNENAGNEYKNLSIGTDFSVQIQATQLNYEEDSFGPDYDELAPATVVGTADELAAALATGGDVKLQNDITGVDANTAITVAKGTAVNLDLNGHKITASANKTGNQELFLVKGDMTVTNGSIEFVAENNQGWSSMATVFDVTDGGSLKIDGVTANVSGTDMNFFVHLNNWGTASLEMTNCDITTTYTAVRVFNSGYDMNTVTIKDTDFHTGRAFWVHCYTAEGADDSTLTLDIYGNNNTTDNAKPVRFGFDNELYYDINGNLIP